MCSSTIQVLASVCDFAKTSWNTQAILIVRMNVMLLPEVERSKGPCCFMAEALAEVEMTHGIQVVRPPLSSSSGRLSGQLCLAHGTKCLGHPERTAVAGAARLTALLTRGGAVAHPKASASFLTRFSSQARTFSIDPGLPRLQEGFMKRGRCSISGARRRDVSWAARESAKCPRDRSLFRSSWFRSGLQHR
jgi:hypothetical protein